MAESSSQNPSSPEIPPKEELWRILMAQIIQCLGGITGGQDQISNKDAIILYCLANRVEVDYAKLIWVKIFSLPQPLFTLRTDPSVLVDQTKSIEDGLKTAHTGLAFLAPDSPTDEPIIVSDESDAREDVDKHTGTHDASHTEPEDITAQHPLSPTSVQLQELRNQELPAEFLALPSQISSVQQKLQTLDALPYLLNKVTNTLNRFASILANVSHKATAQSVPLAGQTTASPAEGEKNTSPIILKVYREDGTNEVIPNFKVSDLHLVEWKEELKIDFNKPLQDQDPMDELNDLSKKKRKRTGDLKDHSKSTKKHKSSVQHEEEVH
ncbi:hypothetical protein Tco_0000914 [Tanacetum coccineum]